MYEPHTKLTTPAEEKTVWRYMNLAKVVSMLERRSLFFARLGVLREQDPYEGMLPFPLVAACEQRHARYLEAQLAAYNTRIALEEDADRQKALLRERKRFLGEVDRTLAGQAERALCASACCWHLSEHESFAMWKMYGSTDVAIRSTVGGLIRAVRDSDRAIFIAEVSYLDYDDLKTSALPGWRNHVVPLFWKREHFEHEHELRCALYEPNPGANAGVYVPVDLPALVDEVRVAPNAGGWFVEAVAAVFDRFGLPKALVQQSAMDRPPPSNPPG